MIKQLFKDYQRELLKLANRKDGRKFLGINEEIEEIIKLTPNSYATRINRCLIKEVFKNCDIFAKKLYEAITKMQIIKDDISYQYLDEYGGLLNYCNLVNYPKIYPRVFLITSPVFYSDTADGDIYNDDTLWADTRNALAGDSVTTNAGFGPYVEATEKKTSAGYRITRSFISFNTAPLPDTCLPVWAQQRMYFSAGGNEDNDGQDYIILVQSTQANGNALVVEDFDQVGTVSLSETSIELTGHSAGWTTFIYNDAGLTNISKTDYTKTALREGHDFENVAIADNTSNWIQWVASDYTGTAYDPQLTIIYNPRGKVGYS